MNGPIHDDVLGGNSGKKTFHNKKRGQRFAQKTAQFLDLGVLESEMKRETSG